LEAEASHLIAIDTNIAARFLLRDDAVQTAIADATLDVDAFFVSHTVLMELGWVLRSAAGWNRMQINQAIRLLLSLPGAKVEVPGLINWALEQHLAGADWPDMLHLIANRKSEAFVTFDRSIEIAAGADTPVSVRTLV
jgi:predicted nucleic-acid-binding protein